MNDAVAGPQVNPVEEMLGILQRAGHANFTSDAGWEGCLCTLVFALEPRMRTYRVLEALPYDKKPIDQSRFLNTFAHLGYYARCLPAALAHLDKRLLPCLFVSKDNEPMVILRSEDVFLRVYRGGSVVLIGPEEAARMQGHVWVFERFDETKSSLSRFRREGSGHNWFRALLGRFRAVFVQIVMTGFMLNMIALTTPLYIMLVYDRVIAVGSMDTLPMLVVGVSLAIGFEHALRTVRSRGLSWLAARMDNIVGNRIFAHLIGLAPNLIERANVSAQIARIKTFESVRDFFSGPVFLSMMEMPFVVIALAFIWIIGGSLAVVPLAMIGVYATLFYFFHRRVKVAIRLAAKASSARQQFVLDTFEKIRGVRGYGLGSIWQAKFRDLSGREMTAHFHLNWLGMVAETLANALTLVAGVSTVAYGVHLIWIGAMSSGALVASMIMVWRVLTPFYSMCTMIPRLEQIRNSIIQVNKLMDLDTEVMEGRAAARLPRLQGRVTFNRAALRYDEGQDLIFSDLSFEARAGDVVAVTGVNGSGKSSLLKLIKGLYKAEDGAVQIDGFDLRQLDGADLRRQIAYVPQHPDFFHGTILDNLRIGNPLVSMQEAQRALEMADAWSDVQKMRDGIQTVIGRQSDDSVSVNLAVRLSLARAYLHAASILLIDELPNAVLSGQAGKNLKDYIAQTKGKRTTIMVTYRSDFMALADTIVTLRRGENPISGPREQVLSQLQNKEAA